MRDKLHATSLTSVVVDVRETDSIVDNEVESTEAANAISECGGQLRSDSNQQAKQVEMAECANRVHSHSLHLHSSPPSHS